MIETTGWAVSSLWTAAAEERLVAAVALAEERLADLRRMLDSCRALRATPKPPPEARRAFASPQAIEQLLVEHPSGLTTPEIARRLARPRLSIRQAIQRHPGLFAKTEEGRWVLRNQQRPDSEERTG